MWPDCTERSTTLVQIVLNRPYANPYAHCLRKGPVHSRSFLWECKAGKRTPQGARVHQKTVYSPLAQTAKRNLASTACQPQAPGSACFELGCVQAKANWSCKHLSVVWCMLGRDVCALGHECNSTVVVAAAAAAHADSHLTRGPGGTCRTLTSSEHGMQMAFTTSWPLADSHARQADCRASAQVPRHALKQQLKPRRHNTTGSMRRGSSAALAMDAASSAAAMSTARHTMSVVRVAMLEVPGDELMSSGDELSRLLLTQLIFCCVVQDLVLCKPRISL